MEGQFGWGREEGGWRKGPWTAQEDKLLLEYVRQHGEGRWNSVAKLTGTYQEQDHHQLNQPDHDDAIIEEAAPAASLAQQHENLMIMQDMDDLLYQLCPMSSCSSYLLHGGGSGATVSASAGSEGSSEDHQLDGGGDTWGWGSLWNLDDVVDDVDGGAVCGWDSSSSFALLQDHGAFAFY
ncbi:hypothetical protein EJB05_20766, partial [Eragrostis curvula]